jgi:hypothetical protein
VANNSCWTSISIGGKQKILKQALIAACHFRNGKLENDRNVAKSKGLSWNLATGKFEKGAHNGELFLPLMI